MVKPAVEDRSAVVVAVLQAHRRISDELAEVMATEILAALDDFVSWLNGGGYERANGARRKAMH